MFVLALGCAKRRGAEDGNADKKVSGLCSTITQYGLMFGSCKRFEIREVKTHFE